MSDKVGLNEHQYHPYPMGNGVNQEEETTLKSRSVQRRVARQKGLTAPDFSQDDKLRESIAKTLFDKHAPLGQTWIGYTRRYWEDLDKEEQKLYYDTANQILAACKEAGGKSFYQNQDKQR